MTTHTAVVTTSKGKIDVIEVPTTHPGPGEVLLKTEYAAMMAADVYITDLGLFVQTYPTGLGLCPAGTVVEIGEGVTNFKIGDRVTGVSIQGSRSGFTSKALQEYCLLPSFICSRIPDEMSFEDAATIPDNFVTAFFTIFNQLQLPIPESFPAPSPPPLASAPILVYGGGSLAGQYMIQVLHIAGYKNIITTASVKHHEYLHSLGAAHAFDYRSPTLVADITKVAGGKVQIALDPIAVKSSLEIIGEVISPQGKLAVLLPIKDGSSVMLSSEAQLHLSIPPQWNVLPKGTKTIEVKTSLDYEKDTFLKDNLMQTIFPQLLEQGLIKPSRIVLMGKGSFKERAEKGLDLLRNNKVSGEKVVVKMSV